MYADSILGAKRWWVSPPHLEPRFEGNATQLAWAAGRGQEEEAAEGVLACTARAGEAIYIPSNWWHATLNLQDYNAFTSVFVRE